MRALWLLPLLLTACGPAQLKSVRIKPVEIRADCDYDGYMGLYAAYSSSNPPLSAMYLAQAQQCIQE